MEDDDPQSRNCSSVGHESKELNHDRHIGPGYEWVCFGRKERSETRFRVQSSYLWASVIPEVPATPERWY